MLTQVIRANDKLILAKLKSKGNVDKPNLLLELASKTELMQDDLAQAKQTITFMFNLDLDLTPFYAEVKRDKTMAIISDKLRD